MLSWLPSDEDHLAEVDHVDGRRRPWRAVLVAGLAGAAVLAVIPWPLTGIGVGVIAGSALVAAVVAWRFPIVRSRRIHPAVRTTAVAVTAEGASITVWRAGLERRLAPEAVERLVIDVDHVFLHLAEAEVLTIPCRAFGSERGGLDRFVGRVDRFRRGGALDDAPEAGRAAWTLQYGLRGVGLGWPNARGGDLERLVLVGFAVAAAALVLAATAGLPGHGQDWLLFGLVGLLVAVMAGVSWRQVPQGDIALAVGPEGGWMRSRSGSTRFGWTRVLGIEVAPRMVVLRFADRVVPVPSDAFENEPARLRFVEDVRDWWRAARQARRPRPPGGRPAAAPVDDPFAPPAS